MFIGNYKVIRELGQGRTGTVYLVQGVLGLRALKLFKNNSQNQDPQWRELFIREFETLAKIRHPNIVGVDEIGWHSKDKNPFIVFEYVRGDTLTQGLTKIKLSDTEIARLFFMALRTIHFLHRLGILHRDIKPKNILVTSPYDIEHRTSDSGQSVKLIDFGLAQASRDALAGSLSTLAPEILAGARATAAADVYALAASFWVALGGEAGALKDLLQSMLIADPLQRATTRDLILQMHARFPELRAALDLSDDARFYLARPRYVDVTGLLPKLAGELDQSGEKVFFINVKKGCGGKRLLEEIATLAQLQDYQVVNTLSLVPKIEGVRLCLLVDYRDYQVDALTNDLNTFRVQLKKIPESWLPTHLKVFCVVTTATTWDYSLLGFDKKQIAHLLQPAFDWQIAEDICDEFAKFSTAPGEVLQLCQEIIRQNPSCVFDSQQLRVGLRMSELQNEDRQVKTGDEMLVLIECEFQQKRFRAAKIHLVDLGYEKLSAQNQKIWLWMMVDCLFELDNGNGALVYLDQLAGLIESNQTAKLFEKTGLCLLRLGDYVQAQLKLNAALSLADNLCSEIRLKNYLAQILWKTAAIEAAKVLFQNNWQRFVNELSDKDKKKISNFNLTAVLLTQKDYAGCVVQAQVEIAEFERLGEFRILARVYYDLGQAFYFLGQQRQALNAFGLGCQHAHMLASSELLLRYYNALGSLQLSLQNHTEALDYYRTAYFHATTQGETELLVQILYNMALMYSRQARFADRDTCLETLRNLIKEIPNENKKLEYEKKLIQFDQPTQAKATSNPHQQEESQLYFNVLVPFEWHRGPDQEVSMNEGQTLQAYRSLFHVTEILITEKDPERVFELTLKYALQLTSAERGAILLLENTDLVVKSTRNFPQDARPHLSLSIAKNVLNSGNNIVIQDAQNDPRFQSNQSVLINDLRSIICVAIKTLGQTVGVLYLDFRGLAKSFSKFDEEVLVLYCQQAGLAILTSQNYSQFQAKESELTHEILKIKESRHVAVHEKIYSTTTSAFGGVKTQNMAMRKIFQTLESLIDTKIAIHITGESGTGKELLAHSIHNLSTRQAKPFVAVNCGAITETLWESEMFGYRQGAFTGASRDKKGYFEMASGGTLFLDEIGELTPASQIKLLRVIQESEVVPVGDTKPRKVDFRLITATHHGLSSLVHEKKFREDLFYRVHEFAVELPPLRERREDIPALVDFFIGEYLKEQGKKGKMGIEPKLLRLLLEQTWPGNIRELRSFVRVGAALCRGTIISKSDYPSHMMLVTPEAVAQKTVPSMPQPEKSAARVGLIQTCTLRDYENRILAKAYQHFGFRAKPTYEALKISNVNFFARVKELGLKDQDHDYYKEEVVRYDAKSSLKEHSNKYISNVFASQGKNIARTLGILEISAGSFYKWKRSQPMSF